MGLDKHVNQLQSKLVIINVGKRINITSSSGKDGFLNSVDFKLLSEWQDILSENIYSCFLSKCVHIFLTFAADGLEDRADAEAGPEGAPALRLCRALPRLPRTGQAGRPQVRGREEGDVGQAGPAGQPLRQPH